MVKSKSDNSIDLMEMFDVTWDDLKPKRRPSIIINAKQENKAELSKDELNQRVIKINKEEL